MRVTKVKVDNRGHLNYFDEEMECNASANFPLMLIHEAWNSGVSFEDLADGYGAGAGTHGDWSGIRDSSDEAIDRMLERSLQHMKFARRI
jgi:aryl-alcohol dehydrogenase-like predicted oxidoreductase